MSEYPPTPVDEGILDRLSALLSRLGLPITITIGYVIVRETTTCTAVGLKNLLQEGVQQYEIYPGISGNKQNPIKRNQHLPNYQARCNHTHSRGKLLLHWR
jgi:hypothetical protein